MIVTNSIHPLGTRTIDPLVLQSTSTTTLTKSRGVSYKNIESQSCKLTNSLGWQAEVNVHANLLG